MYPGFSGYMPVTAGYARLFSHGAHLGTRHSVAPRVKGRAGEYQMRGVVFEGLAGGNRRSLFLFDEIIVAADKRGYHCSSVAQHLLDSSTRPYGTFLDLQGDIGVLFGTDAPEKLIQIVDYPQWFNHKFTPKFRWLARGRLILKE